MRNGKSLQNGGTAEEPSCSRAGSKGSPHCRHREGERVPTSLSSALSSHHWWHLYNWGHHIHILPVSGCFPKVLPGQGPHLGTLKHVYCPVPLSRTAGKSRTVLRCLTEASITSKMYHNTMFGLWLAGQKTVRLVRNMWEICHTHTALERCPGHHKSLGEPEGPKRGKRCWLTAIDPYYQWNLSPKNKLKGILLCTEYFFSINELK